MSKLVRLFTVFGILMALSGALGAICLADDVDDGGGAPCVPGEGPDCLSLED